ncbi:DJ-1/PfpI family protein [Streptosporangium sp. NPDC000396]|uniref:DJ-1/PfpI family protein n=1 Tax=Streptosporangium sp. NPDC000396 TaxID=3366185 RepID=UPI0036A8B276
MERRTLLRSAAVATTGALLPEDAAIARASAEDAAVTRASGPSSLRRVHMVLFDGVEELDFAAPLEVLDIASKFGAPIETTLVTCDGPRTVVAGCGTRIEVRAPWEPAGADVIIVPGGDVRDHTRPGVAMEIRRGVIPAALRATRRPRLVMASVCTGALLLGAAGLVRGRPCTTHRMSRDRLAEQGGRIIDARVVDDDDLVTSAGVTSGLELALWLVQRGHGMDISLDVERVLEYERRGAVYRAAHR